MEGEKELGLSREKTNEGIRIYKGLVTSYIYQKENAWNVEALLQKRCGHKVFVKK